MSAFMTTLSWCFLFAGCRLGLTNMKPKQLMHTLADLDKKAQELDGVLQNARAEINNVLWDLMELKINGREEVKFNERRKPNIGNV